MPNHSLRVRRYDAYIFVIGVAAALGSVLIPSNSVAGQHGGAERLPHDLARPADVASIDAIVSALYDTISGPAGPRDWARLRSLCLPGARLIPCRRPAGGSATEARVLSVDEFIKLAEVSTRTQGFFEREVHRRLDQFGATAHVFSTYESRHDKTDPRPFVRGINSIQLFFDGKRWWVVTIFWDSERPDQPIPPAYLPPK
jgi:hypothetical protein